MSPPAEDPRAPDGPAARPLARAAAFLVGPTASGKSALALALAEGAGAEILSLDSMQVYRGMDVGTAKPGPAERARVRHHLLDLVGPEERYDVQRYVTDFLAAEADCLARGVRPLAVGGTGLYLQALLRGLFDGPAPDPALRRALKERAGAEGAPALHAELAEHDPASAARIHPNDEKRVIRALEVLHQSGRPMSAWQAQWATAPPSPLRVVGLVVRPELLERRIRERARAMLAAGWVEEARALRDGPGLGPTAGQALGYAEVLAHADGAITRRELEELLVTRTRRFARRQRTWFRRFPELVPVEVGTQGRPDASTLERVAELLWPREGQGGPGPAKAGGP